MKEGAAQRAQDTFLFLLGLRQEDTPLVLAKRGGGGPGRVSSEKQPWPRRQLVHAAGELTEQSTPPGPDRETRKKGKDSPQLFTTA